VRERERESAWTTCEIIVLLLNFLKNELSPTTLNTASVVVGFLVAMKAFHDWVVVVVAVAVVDDIVVDDENTKVRTISNSEKRRGVTNSRNLLAEHPSERVCEK
jgi:hypothetical protein